MISIKNIFLIISLVLLSSLAAYSQKKKIINYTEVGALINNSNSLNDGTNFNGFRTRTGISKLFTDNFAAGIALGTDNYKRSNGNSYNTVPISVNASWYPNSELTGFRADIYGGYAAKLFSNHSRGLIAGAGLGYGFAVNSKLNLGLQTGYNYQGIDFTSNVFSDNFNIGTIRLGLGITFK